MPAARFAGSRRAAQISNFQNHPALKQTENESAISLPCGVSLCAGNGKRSKSRSAHRRGDENGRGEKKRESRQEAGAHEVDALRRLLLPRFLSHFDKRRRPRDTSPSASRISPAKTPDAAGAPRPASQSAPAGFAAAKFSFAEFRAPASPPFALLRARQALGFA